MSQLGYHYPDTYKKGAFAAESPASRTNTAFYTPDGTRPDGYKQGYPAALGPDGMDVYIIPENLTCRRKDCNRSNTVDSEHFLDQLPPYLRYEST
jgi:hypothetical protein